LASKAIGFGEKKRKIRVITPFKVIEYGINSIDSLYATSY